MINYLRKECDGCACWKELGQHCGPTMHGMPCIYGELPERPRYQPGRSSFPAGGARDTQVAGDHYKKMGVEPWDVVDTWPLEQRIGAYRHGALKYLMRMGSKDQNAQEIAKGKHYMEKLLEVLQSAE